MTASLRAVPSSPSRPRSIREPAPFDDEEENGRAFARAVKDPWDALILTLDGGGIRGYSSLLILERLMHEIAKWEEKLEEEHPHIPGKRRIFVEDDLLPCHYFDYMFGTSTGGLIATMLGRLRMTVPQCLEMYRQVGDDLFGKKRTVGYLPLTTKYNHRPLEEAVRQVVREKCVTHAPCDGEDWNPWKVDESKDVDSEDSEPEPTERICQAVCLTAVHNGTVTEAHLLRTYDHRYDNSVPNWVARYNEGAERLRIWQVTRATSAAPFYFKMLEADIRDEVGKNVRRRYKDGGIRENNPSVAAWSEFISLYGANKEPGLLLSIGTGRPDLSKDGFAKERSPQRPGIQRTKTTPDGFASAWPAPFGDYRLTKSVAEKFAIFKNVLIKYTEGEEKHRLMKLAAKGENRWYKRLNVDYGLQRMKLDNWVKGEYRGEVIPGGRTLAMIEEATTIYLDRDFDPYVDSYAPPAVMINQAAEKLVRQRRAREKLAMVDEESKRAWDTFMGRYLTGQYRPDSTEVGKAP